MATTDTRLSIARPTHDPLAQGLDPIPPATPTLNDGQILVGFATNS
ncbi:MULTISPECIES: hypothetical protein [unclassified Embleya]